MEQIQLADTSRITTRLGFGCSSVMGALGRKDSLRLLEAAFDAGIRHFDVAPSYGYGEAESCLGEFIARHPGQLTVTTKFGIPPAKQSGAKAFIRNAARPVLKALPALKKKLAKVAVSSHAVTRAPQPKFTAAEAQASLERSLRALNSNYVDVWLLHEATAESLQDEGLLRYLEDAVQSGKIGTFGFGGEGHKVSDLLSHVPAYCRVLQFEWSVLDAPVSPAISSFRFHHRALTQNFRDLHTRFQVDKELCKQGNEATGAALTNAELLASLMLKASLQMNPASVILFSSKSANHIHHNAQVLADASLTSASERLYNFVQTNKERLLA